MKAHNTHYATIDILRSIRNRIEEDLERHPSGQYSFDLSSDEVRGYRLGLVSVLGSLDAWLTYLKEQD